MPALVAGIHVFATPQQARRGWPGQGHGAEQRAQYDRHAVWLRKDVSR